MGFFLTQFPGGFNGAFVGGFRVRGDGLKTGDGTGFAFRWMRYGFLRNGSKRGNDAASPESSDR